MAVAASKKKNIFSKSSLSNLHSPEQLDQLMQVTRPTGWLALMGIGIVLSGVCLWSFLGSIPTKVEGNGILVKSGGIFLAVAQGAGQIQRIHHRVGDQVEQGTLLATIDLPALEQQVRNARDRLKEVQKTSTFKGDFTNKDLELRLKLVMGQRQTISSQAQATEARVEFLGKKVKNHKKLLDEGLITEQQLFLTQQELETARSELKSLRDELANLKVRETEVRNQAVGGSLEQDIQVEESRRQLAELEEELRLRSQVTSPYAGRIVEITTDVGTVVSPGQPLASIEVRGSSLEAVVYVSANDGKKIRPGMSIHLSPSTVKKEEYGMMVGKVDRVSEYPSTQTGMMALLENEQLVQMFSKDGPPIAIYADLDIDFYSHSGYRWTSGLGPPVIVSGGTVVAGFITTQERAPIELLIPYMKAKLGL